MNTKSLPFAATVKVILLSCHHLTLVLHCPHHCSCWLCGKMLVLYFDYVVGYAGLCLRGRPFLVCFIHRPFQQCPYVLVTTSRSLLPLHSIHHHTCTFSCRAVLAVPCIESQEVLQTRVYGPWFTWKQSHPRSQVTSHDTTTNSSILI